jgi:hypothetical protein
MKMIMPPNMQSYLGKCENASKVSSVRDYASKCVEMTIYQHLSLLHVLVVTDSMIADEQEHTTAGVGRSKT